MDKVDSDENYELYFDTFVYDLKEMNKKVKDELSNELGKSNEEIKLNNKLLYDLKDFLIDKIYMIKNNNDKEAMKQYILTVYIIIIIIIVN